MDHRDMDQTPTAGFAGYAVEFLRDCGGHRVWERKKVVASHDEALSEAASIKGRRDLVAARIMPYATVPAGSPVPRTWRP